MSADFPSDEELAAYDRGFLHAEDYWRPLEQQRIIRNIQSRVADLKCCGKDDNCQELAALIESYIPEWTEETE